MATQTNHEHVCYLCGQTWEEPAHASEWDTTQKIAAEAENKIYLSEPFFPPPPQTRERRKAIIQSAIEKALSEKEALWIKHAKQYTDEIASLRAAHASEPIPCKAGQGFIHWKQEHADLCTICHPELYKPARASENMAPTNQVCPKCGNVGCLTHAHASESPNT